MGSTYVNDFNRFGRTYQVNMQADEAFRQNPQQISQLKVPNLNGDMIRWVVYQRQPKLRPRQSDAL